MNRTALIALIACLPVAGAAVVPSLASAAPDRGDGITQKAVKKPRAGKANARGPQGRQGRQGAPGARGPQGAPGAAGATGQRGATGPAGQRGATGPAGARGPQGAQGPAGPGVTIITGTQATSTTIPADGSSVNVAGLSLPAGNWLVTTKLDLSMPAIAGGTRQSVAYCQVNAAGGSEMMTARLNTDAQAPGVTADDVATVVSYVPATFTAAGRATVSCRQVQTAFGVATAPLTVSNVRVVATKADSLQIASVAP